MLKRMVLFGLVGVAMTGFLYARKSGGGTVADPERAEAHADAYGTTSVGSIRLWQDYEANEVAADNQYKGRRLRVTGRAFSVEKNMMGHAVLHLVSGNPIFMTMATLTPAETPRAAAITRGDTVVVACTGGGRMLRMPQLEDCTLERPE